MTEPNPYEPPKTSLSTKRPLAAAKKAVGFLTLAILAPIAVSVAGSISCLGVWPAVDAVDAYTRVESVGSNYLLLFLVGWGVFLLPPLFVLFVMGRWAIAAYNREVAEHNAKIRKRPPYVE